jgi:hypothetical protein
MPALSDPQSNLTADPQRPIDRVTVPPGVPRWLFRQVVTDARLCMIRAQCISAVIRERLAEHYRDGGGAGGRIAQSRGASPGSFLTARPATLPAARTPRRSRSRPAF